mmetsp:Transcript_15568/g.44251  ORF Transcript_15568/g.44251 Transcript_15568/m.44251 type:complete len:314 (+) Transcript_15568:131-1072(+)
MARRRDDSDRAEQSEILPLAAPAQRGRGRSRWGSTAGETGRARARLPREPLSDAVLVDAHVLAHIGNALEFCGFARLLRLRQLASLDPGDHLLEPLHHGHVEAVVVARRLLFHRLRDEPGVALDVQVLLLVAAVRPAGAEGVDRECAVADHALPTRVDAAQRVAEEVLEIHVELLVRDLERQGACQALAVDDQVALAEHPRPLRLAGARGRLVEGAAHRRRVQRDRRGLGRENLARHLDHALVLPVDDNVRVEEDAQIHSRFRGQACLQEIEHTVRVRGHVLPADVRHVVRVLQGLAGVGLVARLEEFLEVLR